MSEVRSLAVLPCLSLTVLSAPCASTEIDRRGVVKLGRDHQRSAPAIVLIVDMRAAIEEESHLLGYVVDAAS